MSRDNGAGARSVMLAFVVGAVAGAAAALLCAPVTGRETREFLGEKAHCGGLIFDLVAHFTPKKRHYA